MKRIGLFGGSFDPIHEGHTEIIKKVILELDLDHLLVIPCFHSPGKETKLQARNEQRIEMIELVLKNIQNTSVCHYEINRTQESYSIDTLRYLQNEQDAHYFLIIGTDQLNQLHLWKEIEMLSKEAQIVCVARADMAINHANRSLYSVTVLHLDVPGYSSTQIRNGHLNGLNEEVLKYQSMHAIYLDTMITSWMSEYRANHSRQVASAASLIANHHGISVQKALIAGYLHDIAKEFPLDYMNDVLVSMKLDTHMMAYQKHQHVGRFIAEYVFLVDDKEVLNAIESHARISSQMSVFDQLLYVADKNEPTRSYETNSVITLAYLSIWEGFKETVLRVIESLRKKGFDDQELLNVFKQNEAREK